LLKHYSRSFRLQIYAIEVCNELFDIGIKGWTSQDLEFKGDACGWLRLGYRVSASAIALEMCYFFNHTQGR
jgi:hypothetical protein